MIQNLSTNSVSLPFFTYLCAAISICQKGDSLLTPYKREIKDLKDK